MTRFHGTFGGSVPAMLRAVLLVPLLLLACSHLQAQFHQELSDADIRCVLQSREETALGRWLDCLQSALDADKEDETATADNGSDEYPHTHELVIKKDPVNGPFTMKEEETPIEKDTVDALKDPINEPSTMKEEETEIEKDTVDPLTEEPSDRPQNGDPNCLQVQSGLPHGRAQNKGERHDYSTPAHIDTGDAEDSGVRGSSKAEEAATIELRDMGEYSFFGWLRLNLGMLALGKLLSRMVHRCREMRSNKTSPDTGVSSLGDDTGASSLGDDNLTAAIQLKVATDTVSQEDNGTSHLQMLGHSLGSSVGAVFAEVMLKMGSSGSPLPADKISLILESALLESSTMVEDDAECSKLLVDFCASFKSTYAMLYRIHQASSACEDRKEVNCTYAGTDTGFMPSGGEEGVSDLTGQVLEKEVLLNPPSHDDEEEESLLTVEQLSEEHIISGIVAEKDDDDGSDAIHLGSSFAEQAMVSKDDVHPHADSDGNKTTMFIDKKPMPNNDVAVKEIVEVVLQPDYEVDDASSLCEEPSSIMRSGMFAFMDQSQGAAGYQKVFLSVFERHVQAQEQQNQLKYVEVKHLMKQRILEKEKLRLTQDANILMRENIDLGRSKACFKEATVLEKQAKEAYMSLSKTCADELVAGLFVMLASLLYGTRKYSVALLSELVSTCQPLVKEPRRSSAFHIDWFYTSLDLLAAKLQALLCHVTVSARIVVGGILGITLVSTLLRRSLTSSSQAMPATVLVVVLGGVCGYVGKLSVDSLGGSGTRWCVMWEIFCFLHASINCFTPFVYRVVHGPLSGHKPKLGPPFWMRKLAFHCMLLIVLPGLAGQLPFASLYHVVNDLGLSAMEVWSALLFCMSEWSAHVINISHTMFVQYVQ